MTDFNIEERIKKIQEYTQRLNEKRGQLLNDIVELEIIIESLIGYHFCNAKNKRLELLKFVIRDMNLDRKISLLSKLVDAKYFKEIISEHPTFIKDLHFAKDIRNRLAHLRLHVDFNTVNKNLKEKQFEFLNKEREIKTVLETDIEKAKQIVNFYAVLIQVLYFKKHYSAT